MVYFRLLTSPPNVVGYVVGYVVGQRGQDGANSTTN